MNDHDQINNDAAARLHAAFNKGTDMDNDTIINLPVWKDHDVPNSLKVELYWAARDSITSPALAKFLEWQRGETGIDASARMPDDNDEAAIQWLIDQLPEYNG